MSEPIWKKLIALVELDQQISSKNKDIENLDKEISENQNKISLLKEKFNQAKEQLNLKAKRKDAIELRINEIDELEKKKKTALDNILDQKAYKALHNELSILSTERNDQEELLIEAWNDVENLEKKLEASLQLSAETNQKFEDLTKELDEKKEKILKQISEIQERQSKQIEDVPEKWLRLYNQMKTKVADPVVPIVNSSCSACYYMILPQDLRRIENGALLHCKNCYRLLYKTNEEEPVF